MFYDPRDPWLSSSALPSLNATQGINLLPIPSASECSTSTWNAYLVGNAAGKSLRASLTSWGYDVSSIPSSMHSLLERVFEYVCHFPQNYQKWWLNLLTNDPIHVLIETALLSFLVYLIVMRKKSDWRAQIKDKLNDDETEELLRDWKERGRMSLVPGLVEDDGENTSQEHRRSSRTKNRQRIIEGVSGSKLTVRILDDENDCKSTEAPPTNRIQTVLNFATHDFLGLSSCPENESKHKDGVQVDVIKDASRQALLQYGCGSCGPRGFYGTIDAHLDLEHDLAAFTNSHDGIMYSDGGAACASTVAAFAKRGDLLIVDEGVYEALGTGVTLSRANVKYFRHNDMEDLRRVMERVRATDISLGRKSNDQKRFIVVEGLYRNYGTICPLDELVKLKNEFCYRLILDESCSFGVLGSTGRGALEHFGLQCMRDAEIVIISLENSLGSVGAVTVGNEEVVDHQRLSGAGYCFSASSPPFLARAAQASLKTLGSDHGIAIVQKLHENITYFYDCVAKSYKLNLIIPSKVLVTSTKGLSPMVFFKLAVPEDIEENDGMLSREEQIILWDKVSEICMDQNLAVVSTGQHVYVHLHKKPSPALKLNVLAHQSKEDIDYAISVLEHAMTSVILCP